MKQFYILLVLGAILFQSTTLLAQATFSTSVNEKEIGKDDEVEVSYTVENGSSVESITPPNFKGFTVLSGPNQMQGMSSINGNLSQYQSISFLLKPNSTGKLSIQGGTAIVNGKTFHSNAVVITVSTTSHIARSTGPAFNLGLGLPMPKMDMEPMETVEEDFMLRPNESPSSKISGNLFPKVDVSKTTCYQGEPVVATYKLYSRLRSESKVTKRPTLNGFSVYDMEPPNNDQLKTEKINGKAFYVHTIRKVQLYPLQEGTYEIDPVELDNTCRFLRVDSKSKNIQQLLQEYSNNEASSNVETQNITLASKPVMVKVMPLPEKNKPAVFDGAVGKFSLTASLENNQIALNETGKLIVEIKGAGNLPLINAPTVNWPAGIEVSEPVITEEIDKTVAPINGSKKFVYDFNASQMGTITIPSFQWAYFDPAAATYKTLKTDSFKLTITAASDSIEQAKKQLLPASATTNKNSHLKISVLWWLLPVALVVLLGIRFWAKSRNKKEESLSPTSQQPQAVTKEEETPPPSPVQDPLTKARLALYENNARLCYQETGNALWNTVAQKLNISSSDLNKPTVIELLQKKNLPSNTIQQFEQVMQNCEMALYTPVHTESNMKDTLQKAASFIEQLQSIK